MSESKRTIENRERRAAVLNCLEEGKSQSQIADELFCCPRKISRDVAAIRLHLDYNAYVEKEGHTRLGVDVKYGGEVRFKSDSTLRKAIRNIQSV